MINKVRRTQILFKAIITIALISSFFTGCSTKIPVQKEVGVLNLKSKEFKQLNRTDHVIAIVSPIIAAESAVAKAQNQASMSPLAQIVLQKYKNSAVNYDFYGSFTQSYAKRLKEALENSISEIISAKGFKLKGPYAVFDDITYQDKKLIYLALVPKVDFSIDNKIIKKDYHRLYAHTEGVIQIGGSVVISMVEPLTGQIFLKRRINLSDFNIQEPYIYEVQTKMVSGSLTGSAIDKATAPDKLIDTTDVALTKAINKFYEKTIEKIDTYIDRDEILSFEKDILKLKGLKRF